MTEEQLQDIVHSLYEGDTSTPSSTDEDYLSRRAMMNAAINRWEHNEGTLWTELWTQLEDAGSGDTTTDGTDQYDAPSDFRFPGGYVRIVGSDGTTYYQVKKPEDAQIYRTETSKKICWFTGNPKDGYKLNFLTNITTGQTIKYEYYKTADTLTATSSIPEMKDPYFIVYFVLARLYKLDGLAGQSVEALRDAEARLGQMKVENMMAAPYQFDSVFDNDFKQGTGGFGVGGGL